MQLLDIKRMAHNILENRNIESSFIEYKKTTNFKEILHTVRALTFFLAKKIQKGTLLMQGKVAHNQVKLY